MSNEAGWSAMAAGYERFAEPLTVNFARTALSLAGGVQKGDRVLDVAAGTGALALAAAEAGASVLATDIAPGMVQRLRERLQFHGNCDAEVMDGQALTLDDATFDASFSIFGVMLFPDWRRGLAELVRATRPGGKVVVATWANADGGGPPELLLPSYRRTFPDAVVPSMPAGLSVLCSPHRLEEALNQAGCTEIVVHSIEGAWGGPSVDDVMDRIDALLNWMPLFGGLDTVGRTRLNKVVRDAIESRTEAGQAVRMPVKANIAVGRKRS